MVGVGKLCYVVVVDNEDAEGNEIGAITNPQPNISFWYTRQVLQSVLQLVGCKVNHSFKISRRVFDILERENLQSELKFRGKRITFSDLGTLFENPEKDLLMDNKQELFDLYKKETTVIVKRERFLDAICHSLAAYHYVGPSQRADVVLACRLRERKESMIILLCGTSGCGKSTLSSLLASRLGITTVISTDSIRHMMRSFVDEKDNPLLWASTYHAGEFLDPVSIAEAKARKKDAKLSTSPGNGQFSHKNETVVDPSIEVVGSKVLAVEGYKAQSEMVIDSLDRLIAAWEDRKESVVVEGVHLSLNFVMGLMKKHPSIMPFLIYIADEEKHLERFAVRAKYMTLNPQKNKYVKYIRNIRTIQDYLCKRADKHLVPKVNNTNVDRSVASIHSTIFSCLRRRQMGESLYDTAKNTVKVINEEYCKHSGANSIGSKGMFRMIQRQDSSRRYVAIVNSDGSVAKAWPFSYADNNEELTTSSACNTAAVGSPIYGPLQVGKTEPVNIQFGNFGIGFWPNDVEGTSYTGSINDSRVDGDEETARFSPCSSSPLHSEGCEKELTEEVVVSESEEEILDEDAGSSDTTEQVENEEFDFDGSVIESSTRSDEEYEADQLNERLNGDSVGQSNLHEGFHADQNPNSFLRTLSMIPNGKSSRERRLYKRSHSFPTKKRQSNKPKNASTTESSSAACMDGAN